MTLKNVTKIVLLVPVVWAMATVTVAIFAGKSQSIVQAMGAFTSIYVPALGAFVTGTSIKRAQQTKQQK
jgi:hypothetical protein